MNSQQEVRFLTRIFGPLVSPKGASIILIANVAFASCLTWSELSVTARLQRNSTIATLLALEIRRESSTDLGEARKIHAGLIKTIMARMQDPAMWLLGILRPKSSPEVLLMPVINILAEEKSNSDDKEALKRAADMLEEIGKLWSRGENRTVSIWAHQSKARIATAEHLLEIFYQSSARFQRERNVAYADIACLDSRFATAMFLGAWIDYDGLKQERIAKRLACELDVLHDRMLRLAKTLPAEDQRRLRLYAENIQERATFLTTLSSGGLPAARNQLVKGLARR